MKEGEQDTVQQGRWVGGFLLSVGAPLTSSTTQRAVMKLKTSSSISKTSTTASNEHLFRIQL